MLKENISCRLITTDFISDFGIISSLECRNIENIQGDSLARGPKLLSIKNYVIEVMT